MADERIFISYSRKDIHIVEPLVREIERRLDVKCWIDLDGIESDAENFSKVICNAINTMDVFLFMDSQNSEKSEWAGNEIHFAQKKNKKIVLILLDGKLNEDVFVLEYGKRDNINPRNGEQSDKLIRNIHKWLNKRKPIAGFGPLIVDKKPKPKPVAEKPAIKKVAAPKVTVARPTAPAPSAPKVEAPTQIYAKSASVEPPMKMVKCSNCGTENPHDQKFCGKCGVAVGMDLKIDQTPSISKKIPLFVGVGIALLILVLVVRSCVSNDAPEAVAQNLSTYATVPTQTSGAEIKSALAAAPAQKQEVVQKQDIAKTITVDETTFIDGRDNQQYKSVKIGNVVWMSENLRYAFGSSVCNAAGCEKFGRYYTPGDIASLCPEGWRMPRTKDFANMQKNCKKNPGFCLWAPSENQGSNEIGFSALAVGRYDLHISKFVDVGSAAFFLAETNGRVKDVYTIKKGEYVSNVIHAEDSEGFSVRCVKK